MHKLFRFLIQPLKSSYFYKSCFFHFQLGVPKGKVIHTLTKSKALTEAAANSGGWAHIVVGQHHTLALDAAGNVHALGRMEYGRLGTSLHHIQNFVKHKYNQSIFTNFSNFRSWRPAPNRRH